MRAESTKSRQKGKEKIEKGKVDEEKGDNEKETERWKKRKVRQSHAGNKNVRELEN